MKNPGLESLTTDVAEVKPGALSAGLGRGGVECSGKVGRMVGEMGSLRTRPSPKPLPPREDSISERGTDANGVRI